MSNILKNLFRSTIYVWKCLLKLWIYIGEVARRPVVVRGPVGFLVDCPKRFFAGLGLGRHRETLISDIYTVNSYIRTSP